MSITENLPNVSLESASQWVEGVLEVLRYANREDFDGGVVCGEHLIESVVDTSAAGPMGHYESPRWVRAVAGMLAVDWACYDDPVERMGFERLAYMAHVFPRGFRLWWGRLQDTRVPVGYTAWHPISRESFLLLDRHANTLGDRSIVPLSTALPGRSFLYLVNFSIIAALRTTEASRAMLCSLSLDLQAVSPAGVAAVAVSEEGVRVVERFGLGVRGAIRIGAHEEKVFTWRAEPGRPSFGGR